MGSDRELEAELLAEIPFAPPLDCQKITPQKRIDVDQEPSPPC